MIVGNPHTIEAHFIWGDALPIENTHRVELTAWFMGKLRTTVIRVIASNYPYKDIVLEILVVSDEDFREGILKAQQLWAFNQDDYRAKAIELVGEGSE